MLRMGTLGNGTAWMSRAKRFHRPRPSPIPSGTPTTIPRPTATVACHATVAAS